MHLIYLISRLLPLLIMPLMLPHSLSGQDRSPRMVHSNHFEFPEAAYGFDGDHYAGHVSAVALINREGKVVDFVITRASHQVFAEAFAEALVKTPFRPALRDGRPITAHADVRMNYERRGDREMMRTDTLRDRNRFVAHYGFGGFEIADPKRLDQPLQLRNEVESFVVLDDDDQPLEGEVRMQYFIDRDGSTRLASPLTEADPRIVEFARRTIASMRFNPPTQRGRTVPVRVTQWFSHQYDGN
ncbi:MAG: energy transducer TonB [Opitutales bacterium]|nr:energy transducer TonB [Opitutales bacterium]